MTTITSTEACTTATYINLGTHASQNNVGAQTIIAYCKPTASGGGGFGRIFGKQTTPETKSFLVNHNSGSPALYFSVTASSNPLTKIGTASEIVYGNWQHLEVTWDGGLPHSGVHLYINGTESTYGLGGATDASGTLVDDAAFNAYLMNKTSNDRGFVGDIAYIARWSSVLSAGDRTSVRDNGPLSVAGCTLCWANDQDYSTNGITASARSTRVTGSTPTNTALGGATAATATTLTGPSSGTVSVASTNFTVGADGTITGTVTVTPADGGAGGTFTPTTVAISSGTPTGTFTYTPASTGVKTISISDDGGLTDASTIAYTSNAAAGAKSPAFYQTFIAGR